MDSASLEQLLASLTPEPHAEMVAGASAGSAPAHDGPLALVNAIPHSQDLTHQADCKDGKAGTRAFIRDVLKQHKEQTKAAAMINAAFASYANGDSKSP